GIVEQHDHQAERCAQPGVEAGLTGERYLRMLDREIPQIERLAKRKQGEQQKPIGLAGGRQKELGLHGSAHYAPRTLAAQPAAGGTKRKTARVRSPGESAQTRDRQCCEKGRFGDGARSRIPPFPPSAIEMLRVSRLCRGRPWLLPMFSSRHDPERK